MGPEVLDLMPQPGGDQQIEGEEEAPEGQGAEGVRVPEALTPDPPPMPITPSCDSGPAIEAPDAAAGKRVQCPGCGGG